jgi:hypothetical protein
MRRVCFSPGDHPSGTSIRLAHPGLPRESAEYSRPFPL